MLQKKTYAANEKVMLPLSISKVCSRVSCYAFVLYKLLRETDIYNIIKISSNTAEVMHNTNLLVLILFRVPITKRGILRNH